MPVPIPVPVRQAIARRAQGGESPPAIARALGLPVRTVYHLIARSRHGGAAGLAPGYRRGERPRTRAAERLRAAALDLRREHPTWGAGLIRLRLKPRPATRGRRSGPCSGGSDRPGSGPPRRAAGPPRPRSRPGPAGRTTSGRWTPRSRSACGAANG
jgi:hypothetical protein